MPNFLFWNTYKKPIQDYVTKLVIERQIDILILAECELIIPDLIDAINKNSSNQYEARNPLPDFNRPLEFIYNSTVKSFHMIRDTSLGSFGVFQTQTGKEIIIAGTHFPNKRDNDDLDFNDCAEQFRKTLEEVETTRGHSRSIIVGDMNMSPFEDGMFAAKNFHAVMDRRIAKKKGRIVKDRFYKYLYNPMWGKMGDLSPGPPGTYYHNRSGRQRNYHWHTFDQVLVRPDLLRNFPVDKLEVLQSIDSTSLLTKSGLPKKAISDHLPIVFSIE